MARPIANTRRRPTRSPIFAPVSMNAAITSVYAVIANCTSGTDVFRSDTTCEIDTFITVVSSTITNCAAARTMIVVRLRIQPAGTGTGRASHDAAGASPAGAGAGARRAVTTCATTTATITSG